MVEKEAASIIKKEQQWCSARRAFGCVSDNRDRSCRKIFTIGECTANSPDPNGYTPVHAAASYGHRDLLYKLINVYNGDINVRDEDGDTPLHHVEDYETL